MHSTGALSLALDGAAVGHFEGVPEGHVRVFGGDGEGGGGRGGLEVEMEAAEVQSLSTWNLSRCICLASAMRTDSAMIGMVLIWVKGAGSLWESQLGLVLSAYNDGCESTASGPAGDEESERSPFREVGTSP